MGNPNPYVEVGQAIQWLKGQTIIYKTLHWKLNIVQHEPN
jgi:hypothetical protein